MSIVDMIARNWKLRTTQEGRVVLRRVVEGLRRAGATHRSTFKLFQEALKGAEDPGFEVASFDAFMAELDDHEQGDNADAQR